MGEVAGCFDVYRWCGRAVEEFEERRKVGRVQKGSGRHFGYMSRISRKERKLVSPWSSFHTILQGTIGVEGAYDWHVLHRRTHRGLKGNRRLPVHVRMQSLYASAQRLAYLVRSTSQSLPAPRRRLRFRTTMLRPLAPTVTQDHVRHISPWRVRVILAKQNKLWQGCSLPSHTVSPSVSLQKPSSHLRLRPVSHHSLVKLPSLDPERCRPSKLTLPSRKSPSRVRSSISPPCPSQLDSRSGRLYRRPSSHRALLPSHNLPTLRLHLRLPRLRP